MRFLSISLARREPAPARCTSAAELFAVGLLLLATGLAGSHASFAQQPAATADTQQATAESFDESLADQESVKADEPSVDLPITPPPCQPQIHSDGGTKWIDSLRNNLYRVACSSSYWVDGLFGDERFDNEYQETHGYLSVGPLWSERAGWDRYTRIKARVYFPKVSKRFNAFIGRLDRDDFVTEDRPEERGVSTPKPEAFSDNLEDATLLGLGYNEPLTKHGAFDGDVGVRVRAPLDPYVKGSYRYAFLAGERDMIRTRETIFWQDTEGFGATALLDWDHVLGDNFFFRLTGSGTISQKTIGIRWYSTATVYQVLSHKRSLAYQLKSFGSTDNEVPLNNYGFTVIHRRTAWRDWLWVEARVGVDWPRDVLAEARHSNLNAALVFELRYGKEK